MKKLLFTAGVYMCLFVTGISQDLDRKISSEDLVQDFETLSYQLKHVHAGLYTYHSPAAFDEIFQSYKNQLSYDMNPLEFYKIIGPLISDIGDVHTEIEPPESFYDRLNTEAKVFPLSVSWIQEKLYILDDFSEEQWDLIGKQVLSINGVDANEVFTFIRKYVPRDGQNLTSPNHALSGVFGQFRNYYASLYGHPETFELSLRDSEGREESVTVKGKKYRAIYDRYDEKYAGVEKESQKPKLAFEIKDQVAILTVKSFHPGQIKDRGQKFKKFFKQSFQSIHASGVKELILDIRGNGGGHESVFIELYRYLSDQAFQAYKQLHTITQTIPNKELYLEKGEIAYIEKQASKKMQKEGELFLSLDEMGTQLITPYKNAFQGKLYVLIDGKSSSAAGDFTGLVQSFDRAVFVGEEAGGNPYMNTAGSVLTLVLPKSGLQILIPVLLYTINNAGTNDGHGVRPDHPIELSIEDVLSKKDKAMDFTFSLIEK